MRLTLCWNSQRFRQLTLATTLLIGSCGGSCAPYVPAPTVPEAPAAQPQLELFRAALKAYLDQTQELRKQAAARGQSVPNQSGAAQNAEDAVRVRERAMADAIRQLRPAARQGDLFALDTAAALRARIASEYESPRAGLIRDELEEQNEGHAQALTPTINQPLDAPRLPPLLLSALPPLPDQLEFGFSGRALVLRDVDANIVIDFLPDALPEQARTAAEAPSQDRTGAAVPGAVLPVPDLRGGIVFGVIGDNGSGDRAQYRVAESMLRYFNDSRRFAFVIMLGDNLYHDDYMNEFSVPYKPLLDRGVLFYASLGNHDRDSEVHFKPFNMNDRPYYAFTKGNARFVVLDSNQPASVEQQKWFDTAYGDTGDKWRIAYFHHPLYSSGQHAEQSRGVIRPALEPSLARNKVNVVFGGHEHLYERIAPQKGVRYFVSGGGGRRLYGVRKSAFDEVAISDHHFMIVSLAGDQLFFEAITPEGRMLDCGLLWRTPEAEAKGPSPEARAWTTSCQAATRAPASTNH